MTRNPHRRFRGIRLAGASLIVAAAVAVPAPPAAASVVGLATWKSPFGGDSDCEPVATTTVVCDHEYYSGSVIAGRYAETCVAAGVWVGLPPLTPPYIDSCSASLIVTTAGVGRNVNDDTAVCDTLVVGGPKFTIATPYGYYELPVDVENNEVISVVSGRKVFDGIIATVSATFTGGCGLPNGQKGAFEGTFTLTAL